ncbi:MAG: hypothetical protein HQM09_05365 [Candidatus Riflebacteria bacterium]|nr:hypothetical protein [Candidatus Riflebacteria bacterium]
METRRWPMILFTIMLIALIYNFLATIFSSDVKRFSNDRIYVDYSTYKKTPTEIEKANNSPIIFQQIAIARKSMDTGRMESSMQAYNSYFQTAISHKPPPPMEMPAQNSKYEEMMTLARKNPDGLSRARIAFSEGRHAEAMSDFNAILLALPEADLKHRMDVSDAISECFFAQKNKDGYIQFKVKYVQLVRQIRDLTHQAYPNRPLSAFDGWMTSQEATQQLLKVRTLSQDLQARAEPLIRRAEYDLEVARQLNQ